MANWTGHVQIQVTDINGDTAQVRMPIFQPDAATIANLHTLVSGFEAVVAAATNGKVTRQAVSILFNEAQYVVGTAPPNNAEYSSVVDGAHFAFADGIGERSATTIPAPLEAMFGVNSNVVDSTQTQAAALIAFWNANAASSSGNTFNLYKGGVKTGRHSRRRVSRLIP